MKLPFSLSLFVLYTPFAVAQFFGCSAKFTVTPKNHRSHSYTITSSPFSDSIRTIVNDYRGDRLSSYPYEGGGVEYQITMSVLTGEPPYQLVTKDQYTITTKSVGAGCVTEFKPDKWDGDNSWLRITSAESFVPVEQPNPR